MLVTADLEFIELSFVEAKRSMEEGGLPIGSALARGVLLVASGHNQRVQMGDPIAHGEMDCLRKAGRQATYRDTTLYTSLSPCMMCSGTIVQFKIPRVVINDTVNFGGNEAFLRSHGIEVIDAAHAPSIEQMRAFIAANPGLWNEDIME
ncbi:MAG TPA: nucleoside deaminase [Hyphomonadaceae bacterium]|mgnify:CR=1 FL=1|nr:nucleoside deaminase [Hyphomonadaceae bacterium]HPN05195.1 nucleoside deaminase [Hyphomonadaceae bacterium]